MFVVAALGLAAMLFGCGQHEPEGAATRPRPETEPAAKAGPEPNATARSAPEDTTLAPADTERVKAIVADQQAYGYMLPADIHYLLELHAAHPQNQRLAGLLNQALVTAGDIETAIEVHRSTPPPPGREAAHRLFLAHLQNRAGLHHEAIESLTPLLERGVTDHRAALELATAYLMTGQYDKAAQIIESHGEQIRGENPDGYTFVVASLDLYAGRFDEAEQGLLSLMEASPRNDQVAFLLSRLYRRTGDTGKADHYQALTASLRAETVASMRVMNQITSAIEAWRFGDADECANALKRAGEELDDERVDALIQKLLARVGQMQTAAGVQPGAGVGGRGQAIAVTPPIAKALRRADESIRADSFGVRREARDP